MYVFLFSSLKKRKKERKSGVLAHGRVEIKHVLGTQFFTVGRTLFTFPFSSSHFRV